VGDLLSYDETIAPLDDAQRFIRTAKRTMHEQLDAYQAEVLRRQKLERDVADLKVALAEARAQVAALRAKYEPIRGAS
jgi:hypothetical protein